MSIKAWICSVFGFLLAVALVAIIILDIHFVRAGEETISAYLLASAGLHPWVPFLCGFGAGDSWGRWAGTCSSRSRHLWRTRRSPEPRRFAYGTASLVSSRPSLDPPTTGEASMDMSDAVNLSHSALVLLQGLDALVW